MSKFTKLERESLEMARLIACGEMKFAGMEDETETDNIDSLRKSEEDLLRKLNEVRSKIAKMERSEGKK